jgi:hypothetical protein
MGAPERMRFLIGYLRLAEISVGQLPPQPGNASRSAFSHTAKPIKTITVTTSLARVLSLIIPTSHGDRQSSCGAHGTTFPRDGELVIENSAIEVVAAVGNFRLCVKFTGARTIRPEFSNGARSVKRRRRSVRKRNRQRIAAHARRRRR